MQAGHLYLQTGYMHRVYVPVAATQGERLADHLPEADAW